MRTTIACREPIALGAASGMRAPALHARLAKVRANASPAPVRATTQSSHAISRSIESRRMANHAAGLRTTKACTMRARAFVHTS